MSRGYQPFGGGGSGGGTASSISVTAIPGLPGSTVQAVLQSIANNFTESRICAASFATFTPVYLNGSNQWAVADADNAATADVYGLAIQTGTSGQACVVQNAQEITNPAWAWTANLPIYLAVGGGLTQTQPDMGEYICVIGYPTSATSFQFFPLGQRYQGQRTI